MEYILFGESHGTAVGILLKNLPAGIAVDNDFIASELLRRAPHGELETGRHEADRVEFLSGVFEGKTTGMPLVAILRNMDIRSGDYESLRYTPRPGHADYAAWVQSGGCNDYRGGGHFSGRLTAPLVVAGAIAKSYLGTLGVVIRAEIVEEEDLRCRAAEAKANGDSVGGQIRCVITGVPAGIGGPDDTNALESEISRQIFAIPAVKAIGFGDGEGFAAMCGSEANDPFRMEAGKVVTTSNHAGGINGGISNGMPIVFTVTFRPTPSIAKEQRTVDLRKKENTTIAIKGRHDPCIALRAAPVVEAAAALALCRFPEPEQADLTALRRELDVVDYQMTELLERRLNIAQKIGETKQRQGIPVFDPVREEEVLRTRGDWLPERREQAEKLFTTLMKMSREEQEKQ